MKLIKNVPPKLFYPILCLVILIELSLVAWIILIFIYQQNHPKIVAQEEKDIRSTVELFYDVHLNSLDEIEDENFTAFVVGPLEKLCPFYKPDGAHYRTCLYDLTEKKKKEFNGTALGLKKLEDVCTKISDKYDGLEASEIHLDCLIYKITNS